MNWVVFNDPFAHVPAPRRLRSHLVARPSQILNFQFSISCVHQRLGESNFASAGIIPAAIENDSFVRWYKGRDCGPRSGPENSGHAPRGISEGPVGGETRSVSAVRHKTAKKVSTFLAVDLTSSCTSARAGHGLVPGLHCALRLRRCSWRTSLRTPASLPAFGHRKCRPRLQRSGLG